MPTWSEFLTGFGAAETILVFVTILIIVIANEAPRQTKTRGAPRESK